MKLQDELLGAIDDLRDRLDWLENSLKSKPWPAAVKEVAPKAFRAHSHAAAWSVESSLKRLQHWLAEYDRTTD